MAERAEPKISLPEIVLIGLFLAILDAIDLIPLAGDLTDVAAAPLILYYYMKHINGIAFIISEFLDLIPGIQEFPTRSAVWWVTVALDHFAPADISQKIEAGGELLEAEEGALSSEGEGELEQGERSLGGEAGIQPEENIEQQGGVKTERGGGEETSSGNESKKKRGSNDGADEGSDEESGDYDSDEEDIEDPMATESEKEWSGRELFDRVEEENKKSESDEESAEKIDKTRSSKKVIDINTPQKQSKDQSSKDDTAWPKDIAA